MQEKKSIQLNIPRFCIIGAVCVVLVAALCLCFAPSADASIDTSNYHWEATALVTLNVRSGPGTEYTLLRTIPVGTTFRVLPVEKIDGSYTWSRIDSTEEEWFCLRTPDKFYVEINKVVDSIFIDTIKGYSSDGSIPWEHTCSQSVEMWYYHISVTSEKYTVTCDCGWSISRYPFKGIDPDYFVEPVFLGLDTNNDEQYDLKPGQSIDLPCRAGGNLRPYIISEFIGENYVEPPTVTVAFGDSNYNELAKYTFNWDCTMEITSYGIILIGNDGTRTLHPVNGEFMVWYIHGEYYFAEGKKYHLKRSDALDLDGAFTERHVEYGFVIKMVKAEEMDPLDWITYYSKQVGETVTNIFNFFDLGGLLGADDSPFLEIYHFDGVQHFFSAISDFFSGLPPELTAVLSIGFVGTLVIGLVRWLL